MIEAAFAENESRKGLCAGCIAFLAQTLAANLSQDLQTVLLDHRQEFKGHAAGLLGACFPFLDRGFVGVKVAGQDRLADLLALANLLDLARLQRGRND